MPVTIGAKPENGFDHPIGLMKDCHRRIERFLNVLNTLAALEAGARLEPEEQEGLRRAVDYFESAAARHVADEEHSLFPRMRKYPQGEAVVGELKHLEADHCKAAALHATCNTIAHFWLEMGTLTHFQQARLAAAVGELRALYEAHIRLEEGSVFPLAERLLSNADKEEVGREMADRRGLFVTA